MKQILFIMLLSLQSTLVCAQSYLSINVGPALPMGEYSNTDINNQKSGFADLGVSASLKYTRWLNNQKIGLMFDVGLTNNPFNEAEFVFGNQQVVDATDISISSDAYRTITVMPGLLVGKFSDNYRSDVYGFVKLGMISVNTPTVTISAGGQTDTIESESATGFGYGVGVGAHWTLVGNLGMSGTVEYVGGTARLEGYDQPIGNLNALLGILIHF